MPAALIPHPELNLLALLPPQPELTDERHAMALAVAYDNGAYMAIQRVAVALLRNVPGRMSRQWIDAESAILAGFAPTYEELRDYLQHECNVPLILASRVALRLTRKSGPGT